MGIFFGLISAVAAVIAAYFGTVQFLDGRPYIADTRCLMLRDGIVLYVQNRCRQRPVQDKKCFCGRNAAGAADQRGA